LLWVRQPVAALSVGFVPSIAITWLFLSGRCDRALERIAQRPHARAIGPELTSDVNALRFAGLALAWVGCWFRQGWLVPAGAVVIVSAWWLAWRRGVSERAGARAAMSRPQG